MQSTNFHFTATFLALLLIFSLTSTANGQNNRVINFIRAGAEDAEKLTRAYLKPYPNGIGGNLNTGWFNSASTHKTLGFDIQIRGTLAFVPSSDQQFNVNDLDLNRVELVEGESPISPTGAGEDSKGPLINIRDNGERVDQFNLTQGSGFHFVPAPMVQASVGLIKNTDLTIRFIPEIDAHEHLDFNMRGFGLKHSLSQWLPANKLLPVDISVFAGYNRINITGHFDLDPPQPDPNTNYDNQRADIKFDTFKAALIVGKSLPIVNFYGALGYETSNMDLAVTGNYPIQTATGTKTLSDPFSYSQDGTNEFSLTGGLKFKLLFFEIFGEYTLAKYPIANAGIGFSFR